jgi:hypothetical protein
MKLKSSRENRKRVVLEMLTGQQSCFNLLYQNKLFVQVCLNLESETNFTAPMVAVLNKFVMKLKINWSSELN